MKIVSAALLVATITLPLVACGSEGSEASNRTATGADASYIQELIELDPAFAEVADDELLGMADNFCYVLGEMKTPARAMGILHESMDSHKAEMYALHTVGEYCTENLYSLTDWLGYK